MRTRTTSTSFLLFLLMLFCASCEKDNNKDAESEDPGNLKIYGHVYNEEGKAQTNIGIFINQEHRTITNKEGYFEVAGLSSGTYIIRAENILENSSYSYFTDTIILDSSSFNYESLLLPIPVKLHDPMEIKPSSIKLSWSCKPENGFSEYRLYIGGVYYEHTLNEDNGTLVYIGTNSADTTYTISRENFNNAGGTIAPNGTYIFRLYVYNRYGKVSGSNIIKVETPNWDTTSFTVHYKLELETNFAGAKPIKGIDWDNNDNLWIFYYEDGGYINGVYQGYGEIVNYNYRDDLLLDEIILSEFVESPSGIAFDNSLLWVQMRSFYGQMLAINIQTGEHVKTFMLSTSLSKLSDISKTSDGFIVLWNYHDYEFINNQGGTLSKGKTPFDVFYALDVSLGVAERNQEYWISSSRSNEIAIMNRNGAHIGLVETGLNVNLGYGDNFRLAIRNNKLAIATSSQISIYRIIDF